MKHIESSLVNDLSLLRHCPGGIADGKPWRNGERGQESAGESHLGPVLFADLLDIQASRRPTYLASANVSETGL